MTKPTPTAAAIEIARERYADAKVVFLSGSVVREEATATSDLDLVVIYESIPQAYRESFMHGLWPVEAFIHDPETLQYFFAEFDRPTGIPSLANMVAEGIALTGSEFTAAIKELANLSLAAGPLIWGAKDINASRYKITDLLDDLRSPRTIDEARAGAAHLYQFAADHFFRSQQLWSARGKSIPRRFATVAPEIGERFVAAFNALFEHGDCSRVIDFCEWLLIPSGGELFAGFRLDAPASWRTRRDAHMPIEKARLYSPNTALVLIDLQQAVDHPSWGARNNSEAEANVARLLAAWRKHGLPLIHVRHDSTEPDSTYRPGQIGHAFKPEAQPLKGETVIAKRTNSAFIETELEMTLRSQGCTSLVVVGVSSSNSVDTTVRTAGNLGFNVYLVEDATFTFEKKDWHGALRTAAEVHAMSLANLDGEYCNVVSTNWVLNSVRSNHGQRSD